MSPYLRALTARRSLAPVRAFYRGFRALVDEVWYLFALTSLRRAAKSATQFGVVVHVYYPETWPTLREHLRRLDELGHETVVTLPVAQRGLRRAIVHDMPQARVLVVPNRGRDVLPFLHVARALQRLGCVAVLKVHGKRSISVDHESGRVWFETMIERLVPRSTHMLIAILEILSDGRAGVVGPSEVHFPVSVYFEWNKPLIIDTLTRTLGECAAEMVSQRPSDYGFFAGSMFWTRIDAQDPLLRLRSWHFDREKGRLDGTREHAVERVFTVGPLLSGRQNWEIATDMVRPLDERPSPDLPAWFPPPTS